MTARLNPPVITTASLLLHHSPGHDPKPTRRGRKASDGVSAPADLKASHWSYR
jgi:hypothetical protein